MGETAQRSMMSWNVFVLVADKPLPLLRQEATLQGNAQRSPRQSVQKGDARKRRTRVMNLVGSLLV
jgi:hypothetical protein